MDMHYHILHFKEGGSIYKNELETPIQDGITCTLCSRRHIAVNSRLKKVVYLQKQNIH